MTNTKGDAEELLTYLYRTMHYSIIDVDEHGDVVYHIVWPAVFVYFISADGKSWMVFNQGDGLNTFEEFRKWCSGRIGSIEGDNPGAKIVHLSLSSSNDELMKPWNDGNGVDLSGYLSNSI